MYIGAPIFFSTAHLTHYLWLIILVSNLDSWKGNLRSILRKSNWLMLL